MPLRGFRAENASISAIVTIALLGLTLLSVVTRRWGWSLPLELLSHFQMQYFCLGLLLSLLLLLLRWQTLSVVVAIACLAILSSPILPWFIPIRTAATAAPTVKLLFSNLNVGNQEALALLTLIEREQPDIVVLAEVSPAWEEPLTALRSTYPHQAGQTATNPFGLKLLSKYALNDVQLLQFGDSPISMAMQITVASHPLMVIATHPVPPMRPDLLQRRNRQLAGLADYSAGRSLRVVLIGDLNITPWSPYYRQFVQKAGLRNTRKGFGTLPTWPVAGPVSAVPKGLNRWLEIPIDHCLIDPELQVIEMHTGSNINSDHRPIVVTLAVP